MSEFWKKFLMQDARRLSSSSGSSGSAEGRFFALAAFGKHPGWDDHIEDLGLETESLNIARRVLYVQGVGGQIDTGAWEQLKDDQRLPDFNHTFLWQRGEQFLLGRLWSSSDGKGRTRYPMIVCAHCLGVPLAWALENVMPRLVEVERNCQATRSADEVRAILNRTRTALRSAIVNVAAEGSRGAPSSSLLNQFVTAEPFGPANEGWFRIIYWLQSQTEAFSAGRFSLKGNLSGLRAQQIRLPTAVPWPAQSILLWRRFFAPYVDAMVPALFVWPSGEDWVDATFGEPSSQEFFCLRAARALVPLTTEIPYDFDAQFRSRAAGEINAFQSGTPVQRTTVPEPTTGSTTTVVRQGWLKSLGGRFWLLIGGVLVVAAVAVAAVLFLRPGPSPEVTEPGAASAAGQRQGAPPGPAATAAETAAREQKEEEARRQLQATQAAEQARRTAEAEKLQPERVEAEKRQQAELEAARLKAEAAAREQAERIAESNRLAQLAASTAQVSTQILPAAETNVVAPTNVASASGQASTATAATQSEPDVTEMKVFTNGVGMIMLWLSNLPGSGKGGWVGRYEVRQSDYQKVVGANPSRSGNPEQPVENVSWREATEFCRKLNTAESAAGRLPKGYVYALPTLAQWDFFLGNASFENAVTSRDQPTVRTHPSPVGAKAPNEHGLYDVLGNVWEWCADGDSPDQKALKGGAYNNGKVYQFKPLERTTVRRLPAEGKSPEAGFRCLLVQSP